MLRDEEGCAFEVCDRTYAFVRACNVFPCGVTQWMGLGLSLSQSEACLERRRVGLLKHSFLELGGSAVSMCERELPSKLTSGTSSSVESSTTVRRGAPVRGLVTL